MQNFVIVVPPLSQLINLWSLVHLMGRGNALLDRSGRPLFAFLGHLRKRRDQASRDLRWLLGEEQG